MVPLASPPNLKLANKIKIIMSGKRKKNDTTGRGRQIRERQANTFKGNLAHRQYCLWAIIHMDL